jgi:hypothetical protein
MKYYKKNSKPLIPQSEEQVRAGDIVYNELGKCVKKVYVDDVVYFVEVVESVLNDGELVSELTDNQLSLFWTLSKNKFREHEDKNKNSRG